MLDDPPAALLEEQVRLARASGMTSVFAEKVAANALGIAERERALGPAFAAEEHARLVQLLSRDGPLAELNAALAHELRGGSLAPSDDRLLEHLITTTLAKLAVDQPTYAGFRALTEGKARP